MDVKSMLSDSHLALQKGQSNCGPTALLNVLRLKGDFSHTEEDLAQLCKAKVGYGTTTENLVKAAQKLGFEGVDHDASRNSKRWYMAIKQSGDPRPA